MAFAVHLLHVLSMAVIVGGLSAGALGAGTRRLELVLWGAVGVIVATGVGNAAALGDGLPGVASGWGAVLLAKLLLVLLFMTLSMRRSLAIWAGGDARRWYQGTAGVAALVASLGVWLAHG